MVQYVLKEFKTVLNKLKYIDSWFWCRYTINAYQNCEHSCIYCDARSERYHLLPGFDQIIYVKQDVKCKLEDRLKRARTLLPDVVAFGGTADAYQPAEKINQNSRQILEVLAKYKYPVSFSTKSTLILRDLDLFNQVAMDTWCYIAFTITSVDETVCSFLEPRASSAEERFLALETIKRDYPAIQTGVNFMPIVPFLADSEENLEAMIRSIHEVKADFVLFAGLTMRDKQGEYYLTKVKESYPELVEKYQELYQDNYVPTNVEYMNEINRKVLELCRKYSVKYRIKRWIPTDFRRVNYLIAQELADYSYELQIQGKPKRAYNKWLWAAHYINNLSESIATLAQKNQLETIRNVKGEVKEEVEELIKKYDKSKTLESYFHRD